MLIITLKLGHLYYVLLGEKVFDDNSAQYCFCKINGEEF